jgi:hypothetical protein
MVSHGQQTGQAFLPKGHWMSTNASICSNALARP